MDGDVYGNVNVDVCRDAKCRRLVATSNEVDDDEEGDVKDDVNDEVDGMLTSIV